MWAGFFCWQDVSIHIFRRTQEFPEVRDTALMCNFDVRSWFWDVIYGVRLPNGITWTVMIMVGWSVHLTTLFPGQAWTSSEQVICAHTFARNRKQTFLNASVEGRRMTVEIISWSISRIVWDQVGIELVTPESAARHVSVVRHVTDCASRPGQDMRANENHFSYFSTKTYAVGT